MAVTVRFEPGGQTLEVQPGERLLDVVDDSPMPGLPLRCRSANCGTCLVRIEQGSELLAEPEGRELELLEMITSEPQVRLGCQVRIRRDTGQGQGQVRLRLPR